MHGSEALKDRYLPGVTAGETVIAIGISEPEAGSDAGAMNTRVEERDDELVANGETIWVSNVPHADAAVIWAKFDDGFGAFVADTDPRASRSSSTTPTAEHTQTHFYIGDLPVPEENVLARGPEGFERVLRALDWERLGSSTLANAIAGRTVEHALEYAEQREQFGQPIGEFQGIGRKLADVVEELEASRTLTYRAAFEARESGESPALTGFRRTYRRCAPDGRPPLVVPVDPAVPVCHRPLAVRSSCSTPRSLARTATGRNRTALRDASLRSVEIRPGPRAPRR